MEIQDWLGKDNQLGIDIWNKKYRYNDESFEEWLDRVSDHDESVKNLIRHKKFLFGGRTLANRGTGRGSLANCYSEGFVEDSLDNIMKTCTNLAKTYKAQGGEGLSLTKIRPQGAPISNGFVSDGIVPFMEMFNTVTMSIMQGSSRRGALLMSCDIWHKDINKFITIKSTEGKIEKANLSVEIDDEFMNDVINGVTSKKIKKTFDGGSIEYEVNPVELFNLICTYAKNHAEPGIIYTNKFRNYNLMEFCDNYQIETCNPCGEQALIKNGCCNLLSINLLAYIKNPYTSEAYFDYEEFKKDIPIILRASDKIIDENIPNHALQEQKDAAATFRNCGMGIMALGELFASMGLKYGSNESINLVENIMKTYLKTSVLASVKLAEELGNFPGYRSEIWDSNILKQVFTDLELRDLKKNGKLRNCSLLSVAPTGSIGTMLGVSGGIEPFFAISYKRRTVSLNGQETVYDIEIDALKDYKRINKTDKIPDYFVTANEINYIDRIKMQSMVQKYTDTAISSTINLPKETTVNDVKNIYIESWKAGLKGVTIFVDGSRKPILSTSGFKDGKEVFPTTTAPKRPKELEADFYRVKAGGQYFFIFVGLLQSRPYEVFALPTDSIEDIPVTAKGKITRNRKRQYTFLSDDESLYWENISLDSAEDKEWRSITLHVSAMLRHGMPIQSIMKIEDKCNGVITSFTKAIWKVLSKYVPTEETGDKCPECGGNIIREGGCEHCDSCGWSRCN